MSKTVATEIMIHLMKVNVNIKINKLASPMTPGILKSLLGFLVLIQNWNFKKSLELKQYLMNWLHSIFSSFSLLIVPYSYFSCHPNMDNRWKLPRPYIKDSYTTSQKNDYLCRVPNYSNTCIYYNCWNIMKIKPN